MLNYKLDFSYCAIWDGFNKSSHIYNLIIMNNYFSFICMCIYLDIQCDNLSIPANGDISCSSGRVGVGYEGDTCNFTCDNGYQLTGSHTRTCQGNGRWNGTDTMCKRGN